MDPNTVVLLMFIIFLALLFIQVPIALCLGFAAMIYINWSGSLSMLQMATSMFSAVDSFPLMAVPLFILCGALIEGGGLGRRLVNFCSAFIGQFTGGYAMVTVITCAFFGAISGSSLATVAAIGGIMMPVMMDAGYDKKFAIGLTCCSGCLGIIIPPSIPMIMYASSTNASIGTLFLGGFLPGVFLAGVLSVVAYFTCKKRGYHGNGIKFSWKNLAVATKDAIWALLIPVIILGGIYGGIFTPTEAAGVAVVYSAFAGAFIYKELTFKKLFSVLNSAAVTNGTILLVCATATVFGKVLTMAQIPAMLVALCSTLTSSKIILLIILNVLLLIVGCFMDTVAAITILAPMLYPVITAYGIDGIHFGLIMVLNLAIGLCTPPVGSNLFVASGLTKEKFSTVISAVIPFLIPMLFSLIIITYIPTITLLLPRLFGYRG